MQAEDLKPFRVEIDKNIKEAERLLEVIGRGAGGREMALVRTKLQEAKMWVGKSMEMMGSELPAQFRDEAPKAD